jgi:hypothetical protein
MEGNKKEALNEPVQIFLGSNKILLCGKRVRFIFGEKPQAVLMTFALINVPMILFNSVVAVVSQSFAYQLEHTLELKSYIPRPRSPHSNHKHYFTIYCFVAGPGNHTCDLCWEFEC